MAMPQPGMQKLVTFAVGPVVTVITYTPKSLGRALSEIGGLLVIAKLLSFGLSVIHEYCFERYMKRKSKEEAIGEYYLHSFKNTYSFQTFD